MNIGKFACNVQFVITSLTETLSKIKISMKKDSLVITDAVAYNITAKNRLQDVNEKLFWVTCYAHLLHNCCDKITKHYKVESQVISNFNDPFGSTTKFDCFFHNIPKPAVVINTRWGTWLKQSSIIHALWFIEKYF